MRLHWFSPLPPARSAIAAYAAAVLPILRERAELDLWLDGETLDPATSCLGTVQRLEPERMRWDLLNRGGMAVYHVGNQPDHHARIWQASRLHPGVIVLHDHHLQHLFAGHFRERDDEAGYLEAMERHHGRRGRADGAAFWRGRCSTEHIAMRYPLTALAVEGALGVLVHAPAARDALAAADCPVRLADLPYAATPRRPRPPHPPPYRLIAFGHIGVNRRLESLLTAIARLPERGRFRLDVYGEIGHAADLAARIRELGLEAQASLHGFVADAELTAALAASDLAINLRYPTMGEASFSQLQIWDHALPSLVTRVGWYATLPDDAVLFVRPEEEVKDLLAHLQAFAAAPARFAGIGEQGRKLLEQKHRPLAYAAALLDLAAEAARYRPRSAFLRLAGRAREALAPAASWVPEALRTGLGEPGCDNPADLDPAGYAVARHVERIGRQCAEALERVREAAAGEEH